MSRIASILLKARDTLSDKNSERWSDARLLRLLSEAQEDIVIHNELFKAIVDIPMVVGQFDYDLPDNCYRLLRASVENKEIPLMSYTIMDENARRLTYNDDRQDYFERDNIRANFDNRVLSWEDATGETIEAIIYDNRSPSKIRVYPIPNDDISEEEYTFENAGTVVFVGDEMYGVVSDMDGYTFDSVYGVVQGLFDPQVSAETMESVYGVVTQINETSGVVRIWYTNTPDELTALSDELVIPTMYNKALKYYVIAHAYDDDFDAGNAEKSAKALALYEREFKLAKKFSSTDGVRAQKHRTNYRSAFE